MVGAAAFSGSYFYAFNLSNNFIYSSLISKHMNLIFVRHGETVANCMGIMTGHSEMELSENGKMQIEKVAARLKDEKIDVIYSSDLSRAVNTAKAIAQRHPEAKIFFSKNFRERDHGAWDGKRSSEVDHTNVPADFETDAQILERARTALNEIYGKHPQQNILIVSHCGFIKAALATLLESSKPENMEQRNTAVSLARIEYPNKKAKVTLVNCIKHLG